MLTSSETESILWDVKTFEKIAIIEEKVATCYSRHKTLIGILHDGSYKTWSDKLIAQFSDNYKIKDDGARELMSSRSLVR